MILFIALFSGAALAASCDRGFLLDATNAYIAAQSAGSPHALLAFGGNSTTTSQKLEYTEDGIARDISTGTLALPLRADHNASLLDTTQCATFTELIITDAKHPRVIGTQMRFSPLDKSLLKIESLVTQAGDWAFNASGTLHYAAAESAAGRWATIPEASRDSRATIQAAGDAYLDLFDNKSVVVPWGSPCHRLEGSMYTGNGSANDSCNVGVPFGINITHRRYVIDETVGAVDVLVDFATRPDSHMFRVEKGKITQVHTLTVMRNVTA